METSLFQDVSNQVWCWCGCSGRGEGGAVAASSRHSGHTKTPSTRCARRQRAHAWPWRHARSSGVRKLERHSGHTHVLAAHSAVALADSGSVPAAGSLLIMLW